MFSKAIVTLVADRGTAFSRLVKFVGVDLTGASHEMEVRDSRDGGALRVQLSSTTTVGAEGIRLIGVETVDGVPTSSFHVVISKTTMNAMMAVAAGAGLQGGDGKAVFDWIMSPTTSPAFVAMQGDFIVAATATDTALTGGTGPGDLTVIEVADNGTTVVVSGAGAAAVAEAGAEQAASRAQAWAESPTAPGTAGTKSAKTWATVDAPAQVASAAEQAAISTAQAAIAQAAVGPTYATIAAGLAATVNGQTFVVWNAATGGHPAIYAKVGGVEVFQRFVAFQPTGVLYAALYPSLTAAFTAWQNRGGDLLVTQDLTNVPDRPYIVAQHGKHYRLIGVGGRRLKISFAGAVHSYWGIRVRFDEGVIAGFEMENLEIDGGNVCNMPFWAQADNRSGANRAPIIARDCIFRNARKVDGVSYDAACAVFNGGFSKVELRGCDFDRSSNAVGTTVAGSSGCRGFTIFGVLGTSRSAAEIIVDDCELIDIYSDEDPDSANYTEMDGGIIFQSDVGTVAAPIVTNIRGKNGGMGRLLKIFAPFGGAIVRDITDELTRPPVTASVRVNLQNGDGTIENYRGIYSWTPTATPRAVRPVSLTMTAYDLTRKVTKVDGIDITDTTGEIKSCLVDIQTADTSTSRNWQIDIRNVRDSGMADCLYTPRSLGRYADAYVNVENVNCNLTGQCLAKTDDPLIFLKATYRKLHNRNATPAIPVRYLNGTVRVTQWGDHFAEMCKGLVPYIPVWRQNAAFSPGCRGDGAVQSVPPYGTSETYGRTPLGQFTIAAGATLVLPPFGSSTTANGGGDFVAAIRFLNAGFAQLLFECTANTTTLTNMRPTNPTNGTALVSGGAATGVGTAVEVWKAADTQGLRITNQSTSARSVFVTYNPI